MKFENLSIRPIIFILFSIVFTFKYFVENIWHTELDFLVPHRDRLVILSFATSPYQNNSVHEENYGKQHHHQQQHPRPMFIDDDDELAHTHLIEKFHSGTFDENDYFDTHEKLENERTTLLMITSPPVTAPSNNYNRGNGNGNIYNNRGMYVDVNKSVRTTTTPSISTNTESNEKQQLNMENPATHTNANANANNHNNSNNNNGNRRQRVRNRNNGGMVGGRGSNRKNSNGNRERFNDNASATAATAAGRREKNNRRVDDSRENFETKVNNNLEFEKGGGSSSEFGGKGAADTKSQRKYITKIDTTDELPPDNEFELNAGNRKSSTVRDSNIHIVKPADTNTFVPSTPYSTDSKIIEIKPSTVRTSKRTKRSSEIINTRLQIDSDGMEDEFGDLVDEDIAEPRFSVNFGNDEQYVENEESSLKPAVAAAMKSEPDAAVAAALIDNTVVPANVTPITTTSTTSKQLHGFVGCLQHYLKVDKEIGKRKFFE